MKEGLADPLQAYESTLMEERESLSAYLACTDQAAKHTLEAYKEYTLAFAEIKDQLGKGLVLDRCLWLAERKYLQVAALATASFRKLAEFVLQYISKFVELENCRLAAIRKAMRDFISIQESIFVPLPAAETSILALESVNVLSQSSVFSTLFQPEELSTLRQISDKQDIEEAIRTWNILIPAAIPLILVSDKVHQQVDNAWIKLKGLITADGFLHLFDKGRDRELTSPIFTQQLTANRVELELNPKSLLLQLRIRLSRFRTFLQQPGVVILRISHQQKYENWRVVLTRFLPIFTAVDSAA